jgi:hypothetical protein
LLPSGIGIASGLPAASAYVPSLDFGFVSQDGDPEKLVLKSVTLGGQMAEWFKK